MRKLHHPYDRGWDGWMASLTRWTWVWVNSGSGWWTGRPGVLQLMGSQRVGHDWVTELNWTEAETKEKLNSLLMKVEKESEKAGSKLNIWKMKFMASFPITSWQIDGETAETARDSLFLGSQITADGDWSHKIQRRLLLGRKAMSIQESILKIRDIALPTKVRLVKAMVFPVVSHVWMWELDYKESWAPKNWCF